MISLPNILRFLLLKYEYIQFYNLILAIRKFVELFSIIVFWRPDMVDKLEFYRMRNAACGGIWLLELIFPNKAFLNHNPLFFPCSYPHHRLGSIIIHTLSLVPPQASRRSIRISATLGTLLSSMDYAFPLSSHTPVSPSNHYRLSWFTYLLYIFIYHKIFKKKPRHIGITLRPCRLFWKVEKTVKLAARCDARYVCHA